MFFFCVNKTVYLGFSFKKNPEISTAIKKKESYKFKIFLGTKRNE
jgi:hypothetical protein